MSRKRIAWLISDVSAALGDSGAFLALAPQPPLPPSLTAPPLEDASGEACTAATSSRALNRDGHWSVGWRIWVMPRSLIMTLLSFVLGMGDPGSMGRVLGGTPVDFIVGRPAFQTGWCITTYGMSPIQQRCGWSSLCIVSVLGSLYFPVWLQPSQGWRGSEGGRAM
jgi:hypothetical protein